MKVNITFTCTVGNKNNEQITGMYIKLISTLKIAISMDISKGTEKGRRMCDNISKNQSGEKSFEYAD